MVTEIIPKRCSQCKQNKPLSEFSKNRSTKDGLQDWCKSCLKAYQQTDKGKAVYSKAAAKYYRTPNGKATIYKANAKYRACHIIITKADWAVNSEVRAGRMPRPDTLFCHYCSKPAKHYHHYKGYEPKHWLDVVPTCRKCHKKQSHMPQNRNRGTENCLGAAKVAKSKACEA